MIELAEDEEYIKGTDTGDESLIGQDCEPTLLGRRIKSHIHAPSVEKAENIYSHHLHWED